MSFRTSNPPAGGDEEKSLEHSSMLRCTKVIFVMDRFLSPLSLYSKMTVEFKMSIIS